MRVGSLCGIGKDLFAIDQEFESTTSIKRLSPEQIYQPSISLVHRGSFEVEFNFIKNLFGTNWQVYFFHFAHLHKLIYPRLCLVIVSSVDQRREQMNSVVYDDFTL